METNEISRTLLATNEGFNENFLKDYKIFVKENESTIKEGIVQNVKYLNRVLYFDIKLDNNVGKLVPIFDKFYHFNRDIFFDEAGSKVRPMLENYEFSQLVRFLEDINKHEFKETDEEPTCSYHTVPVFKTGVINKDYLKGEVVALTKKFVSNKFRIGVVLGLREDSKNGLYLLVRDIDVRSFHKAERWYLTKSERFPQIIDFKVISDSDINLNCIMDTFEGYSEPRYIFDPTMKYLEYTYKDFEKGRLNISMLKSRRKK